MGIQIVIYLRSDTKQSAALSSVTQHPCQENSTESEEGSDCFSLFPAEAEKNIVFEIIKLL